jgi:hypothetical protein
MICYEELIQAFRAIVENYDQGGPNGPVSRELTMWREKYFESLPKYEDKKKQEYVKRFFVYVVPSQIMMGVTLEEGLKIIEKSYDQLEE